VSKHVDLRGQKGRTCASRTWLGLSSPVKTTALSVFPAQSFFGLIVVTACPGRPPRSRLVASLLGVPLFPPDATHHFHIQPAVNRHHQTRRLRLTQGPSWICMSADRGEAVVISS